MMQHDDDDPLSNPLNDDISHPATADVRPESHARSSKAYRAVREAEALRANLRRRKNQQRARRALSSPRLQSDEPVSDDGGQHG